MKAVLQALARQVRSSSLQGSSTQWHAPRGGLALARNKPGLPAIGEPIREISLPDQLVIPLLDYARQPVEARVQVGASVKPGDVLAADVLAPASGKIAAITSRPVIHPSHQLTTCIVIDVDHDATQNIVSLPATSALTIERLQRAGIKGLGGAGFATAKKLMAAKKHNTAIDTLLVNAVECEPQISCDEALILSNAQSVIDAIRELADFTQCKRCILAIEDDKLDAIAELQRVLSDTHSAQTPVLVELAQLSAIYPSGAEKVLIQRIFGALPDSAKHASDQGILCLNVGTVVAAAKARAGQPLLSRIVTVSGKNLPNPTNVRVRFGTSVSHLLQQSENISTDHSLRVRAGGPLSGFDLKSLSVPITATTNCISVEPNSVHSLASPCIRCDACSDVCPVNLLPQQLHWHAIGDNIPGAMHYGLDTCIECGCCDVVCPSSIELTGTFRYARSAWKEQQRQKMAAEAARKRFEQHEARIVSRKREPQRIRDEKKSQLASADDAIAQALARSRARKKRK